MIDFSSEQIISAQEAARRYPPGRQGKPTHISTVIRHIIHGLKAADGRTIRLDGGRLGGRWVTSVEALGRFSERLAVASIGKTEPTGVFPSPLTSRRRAELDRVDRALDAAGISSIPRRRGRTNRAPVAK
jgi:hypothetical protein